MSTCDFFVFLLSRGPKPDFSHPFFLFGIPVVAVFYGIVTYYSTFKEITWKDFVNLYLYRGVVSFCTYKTCIQESGLVVPWLVFTHIQESGLVVPWLVFTHIYTGEWPNCPVVSFYTYTGEWPSCPMVSFYTYTGEWPSCPVVSFYTCLYRKVV